MNEHSESDRRAAVERARGLMLGEGLSQSRAAAQVGQALGVTGRTVVNWAAALGEPLTGLSRERAKTLPATKAAATYAQERRLALSDRLFTKLETVLSTLPDTGAARDLARLATTYGILTDKRRLEEGQVTDRTETRAAASAAELFEQGRERLRLLRGAGGE